MSTDDEKRARVLDAEDPLKQFRNLFSIPKNKIYLANHSLGLAPLHALKKMEKQMHRWAEHGVEGWFQGNDSWYSFQDTSLKDPLASILGAKTDEVVVMNSLTVNLHLLLVSFYQPTPSRFKIVTDKPAFPSDLYALKSHLEFHGFDPEKDLILATAENLYDVIAKEGDSIALVFVNPVNYLTGQVLEMAALITLAHQKGCLVGCDIAHAAGNIPLHLDAWNVDFAVGCSYKYLCSGPGGPGIAFVHASHHGERLPRFSGWWGNDPKKRFQMHLQERFVPYGGAASWQLSTPSILAMTTLSVSLAIFQEAGIERMRKKSLLQTAFLVELLNALPQKNFRIVTPRNPQERGCQLSLEFREGAEHHLEKLKERGVICDFRPPNILRVSPSPLYTTFEEIYRFVMAL